MAYVSSHEVFRTAMKQRRAKHPFDRISAYKIRECRDNLSDECRVVASIAYYVCARPHNRNASLLRSCTEEDKSHRLKRTPMIVAHELGYNLIPAVKALTLEGVPTADIKIFIMSVRPQIHQILVRCDVVRKATARSIKPEFDATRSGKSGMECICTAALQVAEQAVAFCNRYGV